MKDLLSLRTIDSDQELSEIEDEDFIVDSTHEIAHTLEGRPSPSINNTLPTMEDQESANENEIESENDVQDIVKTRPVLPGAAKAVSDYFQVPEQTVAQSVFTSLQISRPLLKAIQAMGFVKPTEIQSQTIPLAMQGKDICASAVTGSGKTLAFMVPVLERLLFRPKHKAQTRVLVLVPTRGLDSKQQQAELAKNPDIVIATPGRLIDHIHNSKSFSLDMIEILIIDEADRILDDGFQAELAEIVKNTPKKRQTMLFSATMTDNVDELIKLSLSRPVRLHVDSNHAIASRLMQEFIRVREHREQSRSAMLVSLCTRTYTTNTIVFFRSKAACHQMKILFGLFKLDACELHGNLTQVQRLASLELFKSGKANFLLATDLASRGLDIAGVKTVINFDMPKNYQVYVHRIGRTARAGKEGKAVSLIGEADRPILKLAIEYSTSSVKHRIIPPAILTGIESQIAAFEEQIADINEMELQEKELNQAQMQLNKVKNCLVHQEEIQGRPRKTWFQTVAETLQEKSKGKPEVAENEKPKVKRGPLDGLSRHKKRLKIGRMEDKKEMASQKASAKIQKKKSRPDRLNASKPSSSGGKGKGQKSTGKRSLFSKEIRKKA